MLLSVVHLLVVFVLIILVLIQPPESDGVSGFGGGGQYNPSSIFPTGSGGGVLTKVTWGVSILFLVLTLLLYGSYAQVQKGQKIADKISAKQLQKKRKVAVGKKSDITDKNAIGSSRDPIAKSKKGGEVAKNAD